MKLLWKPESFVPFVGVACGFGQLTFALWPLVLTFGHSRYGKRLADIEEELRLIRATKKAEQ